MERNEVYRLIDGERAYQQAQGKPDKRTTGEWLDSIDYYMNAAWLQGEEDNEAERLASIRKVAALAVACLEQYGCSPREGYDVPPWEQQRPPSATQP